MSIHVFQWHADSQRLQAYTSRLKPTEDNKCYCSNTTS